MQTRNLHLSIRCPFVWLRQNLESFKKRLSALEKYIAETGKVLTEVQMQALEEKQKEDVVHGETETAHPGYLAVAKIHFMLAPSRV